MAASLAWATHEGLECLVLRGLPPSAWSRLRAQPAGGLERSLAVVPSEVADTQDWSGLIQPTPGRYAIAADEVRFAPRFPFLAGISYRMVVSGAVTGGDPLALDITRAPLAGAPSTEVDAVYPSVEVLPRNALRFYIHFSAPMSEGLAARHIHLERADSGEPILGAFSPMDFELWDPDRRRLTVLLDPARIKQGLAPHLEVGYPLQEGGTVVLVIEREFRDAAGRPLVAERRRRYAIGPDVRSRVDPTGWVLETPKAGGRAPLGVTFDRPLDRALLDDCLTIVGPKGTVAGTAEVAAGERRWSFVPTAPWVSGRGHLAVDPVLEDLAGNSVVRVFDRNLRRPEHEPRATNAVFVPFALTSA